MSQLLSPGGRARQGVREAEGPGSLGGRAGFHGNPEGRDSTEEEVRPMRGRGPWAPGVPCPGNPAWGTEWVCGWVGGVQRGRGAVGSGPLGLVE